jgi:hypothetical protein
MKIFLLIFLIFNPETSTSPITQKPEKELSPYMPVILNTGGMVVSYGLLEGFFRMMGEGSPVEEGREGIFVAASFTLIFSTIPGHIYVKDHPAKTILFPLLKLVSWGIYLTESIVIGLGHTITEHPTPTPIEDDIVFTTALGIIWLYETIDNVFRVKRYNKRLREERSTSFYLQPIITPKGDIFLTGGIRF